MTTRLEISSERLETGVEDLLRLMKVLEMIIIYNGQEYVEGGKMKIYLVTIQMVVGDVDSRTQFRKSIKLIVNFLRYLCWYATCWIKRKI